MSALDIGITGLRAAQLGLQTTTHNIANASTVGFSRQENKQTTNLPNLTGFGFFGQGAQVTTVRRVFSEFLNEQILGAEGNVARLDTYLAQAQQIDNLLADPSAGLGPAMSTFFQATQQMAADPASIPARQSMLSASQALVARFQSLDQRLGEIRSGVNTQIGSQITNINSLASQVAELNDRIVQAISVSQGNPPNDLLDQRDEVIRELNRAIKVSTVEQSDGSVNVSIGNGQPIVVGVLKFQLVADAISAEDPEQLSISLLTPNNIRIAVPESQLQGGALGGLLNFRDETLNVAQDGLGKVAMGIALTVNDQHHKGIDLTGQFGLDYFSIPQPLVLANVANPGSAVVSANIIQSDYLLDFAAGTITRLADGTDVTPGGGLTFPLQIDGVLIQQTAGAITGGERYLVRPGEVAASRIVAYSDNDPASTAQFSSSASSLQTLPAVSSDYRLTVGVGGSVQLLRLNDNKTFFAADFATLQAQLAADPQGFVLSVDNAALLAPGDSFLIEPTRQSVKGMQVIITDPLKIAAAAPFRTQTALTNKGTGKIDLGSVTAVVPGTFPLASVTARYDAVAGSLVLTGGINTTIPNIVSGQPNEVNIDGLRFTISGVLADGDVFTLEQNVNGVSDNRNAIAIGALQSANTFSDGKTTFAGGYGQIVSFVGNKTREIQVTGQAQQALADQAETSRQSFSGVNLDEEAANLLRFQQAYQASAKVMEIAGNLFDVLLTLGR